MNNDDLGGEINIYFNDTEFAEILVYIVCVY